MRTRTSSGDIVYNKDSAEDEDNEQTKVAALNNPNIH